MYCKYTIASALVCLALPLRAEGLRVERLTTGTQEGFAVVEHAPRLSWTMAADAGNATQSAYEVEISELRTGRPVWSSGKVRSARSHLVPTDAAGLTPENSPYTYAWRVRVWDGAGAPSPWSAQAAFRLVPPQIEGALWIGAISQKEARLPEGRNYHGAELKKPEVKAGWGRVDTLASKSICLRKAFGIGKAVTEATACVCGLGNYELSLNGRKVGGEDVFAPLWSDFDKTVYYNTYDVTEYLKAGGNVAGVILGNGFYHVRGERYAKLRIGFGPPTLLFSLLICYADGTEETICSGPDWTYALSPVTFNCIYGGESYDARLERDGWDCPGYDAAAWQPVVVQEPPKGTLRPQQAPPVKIMERYGVQKLTRHPTNPAVFLLDMGQNMAGFPEITLNGKRGQKVVLRTGEALTEDSVAVDQRRTGSPHYYEYTLKGGGDETWHPRFAYYGFRYIQVEGAAPQGDPNPAGLPVLKQARACFVHNAARKISSFETSNALFNATHRLIEKAVRSNMQAVFTDCPHREKLGWLEQVHLNGPGLLYNYDLRSYAPKLIQDMADAQQPNGAIPSIAPQYVHFEGPGMDDFAESPEWGGAIVMLPFMYRRIYGDDMLIRTFYPRMRAYVDYLTARAEHHIVSFGLGDWYDYGPFRAGFSRNTPVPLVATAHYYMYILHMEDAARLTGNTPDADRYRRLAGEVKSAFNNRFLDRKTTQYGTGSQCSNALPLFLNLPEDDGQYVRTLHNLVQDIQAHGNRLTTGDVGNRYLIGALARNGMHGLIYRMFDHDEAPGYGFQLKMGATTLTEQWDPRQGSSWNHFMMGQIDEWFFNALAGIQIDAAAEGNEAIIIRPQPVEGLTRVSASTETPWGKVSVEWRRKGESLELEVTIPPNATATVYLPGSEEGKVVGSGKHSFLYTGDLAPDRRGGNL
ncbi:MAG: glycoside hydrolase family 78 protein [Mediterranea sp.]|jgi:hypothetical protein|nr:glycoside hydrolase family 78 protein [Mediterranea sp.]